MDNTKAHAGQILAYLRKEGALRGLTRIIDSTGLDAKQCLRAISQLERDGSIVRAYWRGFRVWCVRDAAPDMVALLPGFSCQHSYAPKGDITICSDGREDKYSKTIIELSFQGLMPNSVYVDSEDRTTAIQDMDVLRIELMGDQERALLRDMLQSAITMLDGKKPKVSEKKTLGRIEPH